MAETRASERARGYQRPWQRLGYRSEYAYRTRGAEDREERRQAAGHRSLADLRSALGSGRVRDADVLPGERDPVSGRYRTVDVVLTMADGSQRTYTLRGRQASAPELRRLATDLARGGIAITGIDYLHRRAARRARMTAGGGSTP